MILLFFVPQNSFKHFFDEISNLNFIGESLYFYIAPAIPAKSVTRVPRLLWILLRVTSPVKDLHNGQIPLFNVVFGFQRRLIFIGIAAHHT